MKKINTFLFITILIVSSCNREETLYYHGFNEHLGLNLYHTVLITDSVINFNMGKISFETSSLNCNSKGINCFKALYDIFKVEADTIFVGENDLGVTYWLETDYDYETYVKDLSSLSYLDLTPPTIQNTYQNTKEVLKEWGGDLMFINVGSPKTHILGGENKKIIPSYDVFGNDLILNKDSLYINNLAKFITISELRDCTSVLNNYIMIINASKNVDNNTIEKFILNSIPVKPRICYRTCINGENCEIFWTKVIEFE